MILKEKFTEEIFNSSYQVLDPSKFVKIADDYAIEFVEWLNTLEAKYLIEDLIIVGELNKNPKTKELLKIFKKEKGL
jgi:hypothetical protein